MAGTADFKVTCGSKRVPSFTFQVAHQGTDLLGQLGFSKTDPGGSRVLSVGSDWRLRWLKLFEGLGRIDAFHHRPLENENITPKIQPLKRLPLALWAEVSAELNRLLESGVIERTDASPWISNLVVAKKKGGGVIPCIDLRAVNKAVVLGKYPLPTMEELTATFSRAKVFSKLDLQQGYLQVPLHPDSRNLTAFVTHMGVFRYTRMPLGLSSAPSCFQKVMAIILAGLKGVVVYLDDIVVHGASSEEHDKRLEKVLGAVQEHGVTLNGNKCVLVAETVDFVGFQLLGEGLKPLVSNVEAVHHLADPSSPAEISSFLGMVNFYGRFIPRYSETIEPLRALLKQDTPWVWTPACSAAVERLKQQLTLPPILAHFDPDCTTIVTCDASGSILGAVMSQVQDGTERPVAFTSRSLSEAEKKYVIDLGAVDSVETELVHTLHGDLQDIVSPWELREVSENDQVMKRFCMVIRESWPAGALGELDLFHWFKDKLSCWDEVQMMDVKVKLERVVKENERLHAELRESVEKQLHALPVASGMEGSTLEEDTVVKNLQEQLQERMHAMELWQTAAQELDCIQQAYHKTISDGQIHDVQKQQLKDQLVQFQQHTYKLQQANQKLESTNQQFLKTLTEQSTEMGELHRQFRLKAASQEAEAVRREQSVWERKVGELQSRCTALEEEKYEAPSKVRESVQVAEEATLQKEQALLREKQKTEEQVKTNDIKQLIQDAAVRTRKEVELARKQCTLQIHRMAEELSALQLECADKESQIERSLRERKAIEEELEKVYKEGRAEPEFRKIDALHQRCLDAERLKEDISLTLQRTQNKLKKMEMGEELSRCQEEVQRLQGSLTAALEDCITVSEERLQLQQENFQLRKEMDELRKDTLLIQKKAKQQVSQMEQEYSLKEQELEARVRKLEESSRSSSADLTRLLTAQQKSIQRWKEEATNQVQAFETKITSLKAELNRQKQRSQELEVQLEIGHNTISEHERQLAECQEKTSRLQRRLTQAEQRVVTASQQLSMLTSQ
ncbi:LOW QUALITY PROTEIN: sodium channel and clathrin linker 1-like [Pholidichthys leucotaenia]